jgi:hypothetical protein
MLTHAAGLRERSSFANWIKSNGQRPIRKIVTQLCANKIDWKASFRVYHWALAANAMSTFICTPFRQEGANMLDPPGHFGRGADTGGLLT